MNLILPPVSQWVDVPLVSRVCFTRKVTSGDTLCNGGDGEISDGLKGEEGDGEGEGMCGYWER